MPTPFDENRRAELVASLAGLRGRLVDACLAAERDPRAITLVAVTKTFPASDVATLLALGVVDIGESRDQEVRAKIVELESAEVAAPPRWHFVGRLQSNKCRSVARYAYAVHSVDRATIVDALVDGVRAAKRGPLRVFVQVSLDGDPSRGGLLGRDVMALADHVAEADGLELCGVMGVAPLGVDPAPAFTRLAQVSAEVQQRHPAANAISAGMSGDFEPAIAHGATHVRVGSALLGRRTGTFG